MDRHSRVGDTDMQTVTDGHRQKGGRHRHAVTDGQMDRQMDREGRVGDRPAVTDRWTQKVGWETQTCSHRRTDGWTQTEGWETQTCRQ